MEAIHMGIVAGRSKGSVSEDGEGALATDAPEVMPPNQGETLEDGEAEDYDSIDNDPASRPMIVVSVRV